MQQILHQLRSGGDAEFRSIEDVVPWLELPHRGTSWQEQLSGFERMPDPRIFKTHCSYGQTPWTGWARFIVISRDPRDCCVSHYHHVLNLTNATRKAGHVTLPESFEQFLHAWTRDGTWFRHTSSWWRHVGDRNVLWLRYEDLVTDLDTALDRILNFLNWSVTTSQRDRITRYCSFAWMQEHCVKFTPSDSQGRPVFRGTGLLRKGIIGDHSSTMSAAQSEIILQLARKTLKPDCLALLGLGEPA